MNLKRCAACCAFLFCFFASSQSALAQTPSVELASQVIPKGAPIGPGKVAAEPMPAAQAGLKVTAPAGEKGATKEGMNQGLQVHGHWVIDILNPDGKLAEHREFENALQYDGQQMLLALMSGYAVAGDYEIYFTSPSGQTSPCTSGQFPFCAIVHSTVTAPGNFACSVYTCVAGLTYTYTFGSGPSMKLAGSITSQNTGQIGSVGTGFNSCGNGGTGATLTTVSPMNCSSSTTGAYGGTMTYTSISPVSVVAGQIIQISITITYS